MKIVQVHCEIGIDEGIKKLTRELKELKIPENKIINVYVDSQRAYFRAYIREED